jgi:hypothetical protein
VPAGAISDAVCAPAGHSKIETIRKQLKTNLDFKPFTALTPSAAAVRQRLARRAGQLYRWGLILV